MCRSLEDSYVNSLVPTLGVAAFLYSRRVRPEHKVILN